MVRDTPAFSLRMKGKSIDEELLRRVTFYEYEDSEAMDKVTIKFDNLDLTIDENIFFELGNLIETKFGYVNELSQNRVMIIKKINGLKEIIVEAFEGTLQFDTPGKGRVLKDSTLDKLVKEIADTYKLKYTTEERKDVSGNILTFDYIQPEECPDMSFLASVGREIGYKAWIETDTLFFMPRKYWQSPYMKFVYYGDEGQVLDFDPENTSIDKKSKLSTANIDIKRKKIYALTEDGSNSKVIRLTKKNYNYYMQDKRKHTITGVRRVIIANSKKEAENKLLGMYNTEMEDQMRAAMPVIGEPKLVSKRIIEVHGVKRYSGKYFVEKVIHTISENGYISKAYLVRNSEFDDDVGRFSQAVISTYVNKNRLNVKQFFKKYPNSIYKKLYGS